MRTLIQMFLGLTLSITANRAWAVEMYGTFTGVVGLPLVVDVYHPQNTGHIIDTWGLFGSAGGDIFGQILTGTFSYDTDAIAAAMRVNYANGIPLSVNATVNNQASAGSVSITINGHTQTLAAGNSLAYGVTTAYDNIGPDRQGFSLTVSERVDFVGGGYGGYGIPQITISTGGVTFGSYWDPTDLAHLITVDAAFSNYEAYDCSYAPTYPCITGGSINISNLGLLPEVPHAENILAGFISLSVSTTPPASATDVPEPTSLAILATACVATIGARSRRRAVSRHLLGRS